MRTLVIIVGLFATAGFGNQALFGIDVLELQPVDGTFPTKEMVPIGSGSGLIVGPRHILTNRHVVLDDKDVMHGGFNVLLPRDYRKRVAGRVICVSRAYDLALIELAEPVSTPPITILDDLPPLGHKVTAYGFPTGSQFGVALTVTGGQVSRHPVKVETTDEKQIVGIKTSLWHDAVLTGGSSGGPLMSDDGVLVGLNRAVLVENNNHALAVPSNILLEFLSKAAPGLTVKRVASLEELHDAGNARDGVVFVEILSSAIASGDGTPTPLARAENMEALKEIAVACIRRQLSEVPRKQVTQMRKSAMKEAFVRVKPADITEGQVVRIAAKMTIIQVLDDGILARLDKVMCQIETMGGDNAEFAAKVGGRIVQDIPLDSVFLVAKARSYPTVGGTKGHYIPLYPISAFLSEDDFQGLIESEIHRRSSGGSRGTASDADTKSQERYLEKLRHSFVDDSGKFSADAAVVEVTKETVRLRTIEEGKELIVPLTRLSEADRRWLLENDGWIKTYGKKYEQSIMGGGGN